MAAVLSGASKATPVGTLASCHFCLGTGKFFSEYEGQTNERCRKCGASGKVYLRFVETEIHGHRWHHPWRRSDASSSECSSGQASELTTIQVPACSE